MKRAEDRCSSRLFKLELAKAGQMREVAGWWRVAGSRLHVVKLLLPTACRGRWWLRGREGRLWWDAAASFLKGEQVHSAGQGYPKSYRLGSAIKVSGWGQETHQSWGDQSERRDGSSRCKRNWLEKHDQKQPKSVRLGREPQQEMPWRDGEGRGQGGPCG